jgi:hypothetical protein
LGCRIGRLGEKARIDDSVEVLSVDNLSLDLPSLDFTSDAVDYNSKSGGYFLASHPHENTFLSQARCEVEKMGPVEAAARFARFPLAERRRKLGASTACEQVLTDC